jgi:hypothetical protein
MMRIRLPCLLLAVLAGAGSLPADPPRMMRYQASLADPSGTPIRGTRNIRFAIYDAETGGAQIWSEGPRVLAINDGRLDVLLGEVTELPSSAMMTAVRWLEISVDGAMVGPRQRLVSVPFALAADRLGTKTLADVQSDVASDLTAHTANSSAHHAKTTDAAELTSGTLSVQRLGAGSIPSAKIIDGTGSGLDADSVDGLQPAQICAPYLAGTSVEATLDTDANVTSGTLTKLKEFSPLIRRGTVAVRVLPSAGTQTMRWQVHINDAPVGALHTVTGNATQTESGIQVAAGNRVQVYALHVSGTPGRIDRVELLADNPSLPKEVQ